MCALIRLHYRFISFSRLLCHFTPFCFDTIFFLLHFVSLSRHLIDTNVHRNRNKSKQYTTTITTTTTMHVFALKLENKIAVYKRKAIRMPRLRDITSGWRAPICVPFTWKTEGGGKEGNGKWKTKKKDEKKLSRTEWENKNPSTWIVHILFYAKPSGDDEMDEITPIESKSLLKKTKILCLCAITP